MSRSRIIYINPEQLERTFEYAMQCRFSVWKDLQAMKALAEAGHEIIWSGNERWCVVNGKTFNIHKSVYIKRVIESELEDVFKDYSWGEDGRVGIQVTCNDDGYGYEVLFDAGRDDPSTFDFSKILGFL